MPRLAHALAIVLVAAALAGCANNGDTTPTPTPAATPAATPSPTATPVVPTVTVPATPTAVPTVTAPTVPTPPVDVVPTVTAVYVVSLDESVAAGGTAEVCWRVEGTGAIPHTAIHFDNESHPNATAFAEYDGGAVYPDNGPAAGRTFALPGTFCGELRDLNATTYLRPHALAPGTDINMLGPEKVVLRSDEVGNITVTDFLEIFPANFSNAVCWRVAGLSGFSTHTAIHFDDESHPDATSFDVYDGGAIYANNSPATGFNVTVPGDFCANLTMPESGVVYLRAHIIHDGTHYLSEERNVRAAPRVAVSGGLPATAAAGSTVNVCWRAEGGGTTVHTALHFDDESHPETNHSGFGLYDLGAAYPGNADPTDGPWTLPGPFCANLTMPASGALYFRPHIFYGPGATNTEVGPEYVIRVQ